MLHTSPKCKITVSVAKPHVSHIHYVQYYKAKENVLCFSHQNHIFHGPKTCITYTCTHKTTKSAIAHYLYVFKHRFLQERWSLGNTFKVLRFSLVFQDHSFYKSKATSRALQNMRSNKGSGSFRIGKEVSDPSERTIVRSRTRARVPIHTNPQTFISFNRADILHGSHLRAPVSH